MKKILLPLLNILKILKISPQINPLTMRPSSSLPPLSSFSSLFSLPSFSSLSLASLLQRFWLPSFFWFLFLIPTILWLPTKSAWAEDTLSTISTKTPPTKSLPVKALPVKSLPTVLEKALSPYQNRLFCTTTMTRVYQSELLQTEKTSQCLFHHQGSLFRLEQKDPSSKSTLIFDGQTLWILEFDSLEAEYPSQISRSRSQNSQSFLKDLLNYSYLKTHFEIKEDSSQSFSFIPLKQKQKEKQTPQFLDLKIEVENQQLKSLSYQDEMNNKIRYLITSSTCEKKPNKKTSRLFKFEPKKI
jgi:outer membrane lipoprotein-sorting protein